MSRRNHRYRYQHDCHQDYYYHQAGLMDWITGLVMFGVGVVAIISFFVFDTEEKAKLAKAEATKNYEKVLSVAAQNCNSEVVKFFLERNLVNVYENRNLGETLLEYAAEKGCLKIIQLLVEKKVDVNSTRALQYAAEQGNLEVVKFLLQKDASPNVRSYGQTPRDFVVTMSRRDEGSNKPYREIIDLLAQAEKSYKSEK